MYIYTIMSVFFRFIFTVVLLSAVLVSCAKRGSPSGGDKDETPPKFVKANPEPFTTNFNEDEIRIFFNEYVRKNSYYPRSKYEHPDNPIQYYKPDYALELLVDAGWTKKEGDSWLTNEKDEIFEIEEFHITQGWDRILNYFVQDLENIGIKLNLVVIQNPFEMAMNRKFKIYSGGWVGSLLPSPEGMLH